MKLCYLAVLLIFNFGKAEPLEKGAELDDVIEQKGQPSIQMNLGDTLSLIYPGETIRLVKGRVASIENTSADDISVVVPVKSGEWTKSYSSALAQANTENRQLFLFFTGSNWCGWCWKLEKEVLSTAEFKAYAQNKLVLVVLDFPHKVYQSEQLITQNYGLKQRFNVDGFPTVVVLNREGKMMGQLLYESGGPVPFIKRLKLL